ncbi:acyltransferase family protein [Rheinheimera baltica]|uniref:acyltransferase family protein n=1 Tax=Rheinheimera baltica TaxID=67576 RepID=UPI00273EDF93|nr:acyltransferase [Rheinheimera baltica]MDP5191462.1 acyltransferase [Rheinheimera baltica]
MAGAPGRFPALDTIRAVAIMLVLLRHAVHFWGQPLDSSGWNLWFNGWLGVDLFFALSGFLITHHLLTKWPTQQHKAFIYKYLSKRALRILPLYLSILLLASFGLVPYFQPDYPITAHALLVHMVFLQDYLPYSSILVPLWSLGVEEKFYLLAPLLVYWAYKYNFNSVLVVCVVAVICLPALRGALLLNDMSAMTYSEFFWYFRAPFHFSLPSLLAGAIAGLLYTKYPSGLLSAKWNKNLQYGSIVLLALILCTERWAETAQWFAINALLMLCSLLFASVIYCNLFNTPVTESRTNILLRFIAKLAYPLYLIHLMMIPLTKVICAAVFSSTENISFTAYFLVYLVLSFFSAVALHLLVEKPFLVLKDRY